jgi:hypothetical protein
LSDTFRFVPKGPHPHLLWGKSRRPQSFVPITEMPNPLVIKTWKLVLQVPSEDLSVLLMNLLDGNNPLTLIVRTVVTSGTVIYAEGFGAP